MKNEVKFYQISEKINAAKSIAIFCHVKPDADTVCSGLALMLYLKQLGKTVNIYVDAQTIPKRLSFLPSVSEINLRGDVAKSDLYISVDAADEGRLGYYSELFISQGKTINIDHHITNPNYAEINLVEKRSATCELVFEFLDFLDETVKVAYVNKDIATCLYAGLVADSGGLAYKEVTAQTLLLASKLVSRGIEASKIYYLMLKEISIDKFTLLKTAINKVKFYCDGKLAIYILTLDDLKQVEDNDTDGIINNILAISGVEIAIALKQDNNSEQMKSKSNGADWQNKYSISFRSKDAEIADVAYFASMFGGGGHKNAAGGSIVGDEFEVVDMLVDKARMFFD